MTHELPTTGRIDSANKHFKQLAAVATDAECRSFLRIIVPIL